MNKLNFQQVRNLKTLSQMPNMANTLTGWETSITLEVVTQDITSDGNGVFTTEQVTFLGVVQPLRTEQLELKPEGQRSWEWLWIHAKVGTLNLHTADKILFNSKTYKIEGVKDYSLNGYVEYELVRDYETIPETLPTDTTTTTTTTEPTT